MQGCQHVSFILMISSMVFLIGGISGSVLQRQNIAIANSGNDLMDTDIFDASQTSLDPKIAFDNVLDSGIDIEITGHYKDSKSGVTHIFARQTHHGRPVFNSKGNLNIKPNGASVSSYHQFTTHSGGIADVIGNVPEPKITSDEASEIFSVLLGRRDLAAYKQTLGYRVDSSGPRLCWEIFFTLNSHTEFLHYACYIDAVNPKVVDYIDLVLNLHTPYLYNVWSPPDSSPIDGERQFYEEPFNNEWAPNGWQELANGTVTTSTIGNNVIAAHTNVSTGNYASVTSPGIFDHPIDFTREPNTYLQACTLQLFYTVNWCHDMFYRYGFDEQSGNFQEDNYGKGGIGGDPVIAICQYPGTNNALFRLGDDGVPGEMRMLIYTRTTPHRSSSFDATIVIHEYAHGVSSRLTGGPSDIACLSSDESPGLAEGWSDFFGLFMTMRKGHKRNDQFLNADYVTPGSTGNRLFPYTSSLDVNPTTWAFITQYDEVHDIGEIWAVMLFEVAWNLIDAFGVNDELNPFANAGNTRVLQFVIDGMKLQPCIPTFLEARTAVLEAARFQNDNFITNLVWRGFAMRGLGCAATEAGLEDYEHPRGCQQSECVPQCLTTGVIIDGNGKVSGKLETTVEVDGALSFHAMTNAAICGIQLEVGDTFEPDPNMYTYTQTFPAENNVLSWCFPVDVLTNSATFVSTNAAVHIDFCDGSDDWANGIRFDPSSKQMFFPIYKCDANNFECVTSDECTCSDGPCSCSSFGDCFCDVSIEECPSITCSSCPECDFYKDCDGEHGPVDCLDGVCTCVLGEKAGTCTAPLNIDCENAMELELISDVIISTRSSTEFGLASDQTNLCFNHTSPALWYKFTATTSGSVLATTCGEFDVTYDTAITIMQGTCGSLDCVVANDDHCAAKRTLSTVDFAVEVGLEYYLLVHGWSNSRGQFHLDVLAHDCMLTTDAANTQADGIMFDIKAVSPIEITGFRQMFGPQVNVADILVYIKEGSKDGFELDSSAWTLYQTFTSLTSVWGRFSGVLSFNQPIEIAQNAILAMYVTTISPDATIAYELGSVSASSPHIQVLSGTGTNGLFGSEGTFTPRNWAGFMCYIYFPSGKMNVLNLDDPTLLLIEDIQFVPEIELVYAVESSNDIKCELFYDFRTTLPPIVDLSCTATFKIYFDFEAGSFEDIKNRRTNAINLLHDLEQPIQEIEFAVTIDIAYNVFGPNETAGFMGDILLASRLSCPASALAEFEGAEFVSVHCSAEFNVQEICESSGDVLFKMKHLSGAVAASISKDLNPEGNDIGMDMSPSPDVSPSPPGGGIEIDVDAANSPPSQPPPSPGTPPSPPSTGATVSSTSNCLSVGSLIDPDHEGILFPDDQRTVFFEIADISFTSPPQI